MLENINIYVEIIFKIKFMLAALMEALNGITQPYISQITGTIERGNNAYYEYEVWRGSENSYYLKVRPLPTKNLPDAPQIAGSFESSKAAITYFQSNYI